jgi:hypothetical protein
MSIPTPAPSSTPLQTSGVKTGRPRLDHTPGFYTRFAAILPRLQAKEISQRQAAEELGISVRSLMRYAAQTGAETPSGRRPVPA